ncbi:MAG TPA: winged helix-turn-helix transcriptional regulator [Firmicutes bacterium]|nr:winged helix-turn-helix transcriptional regulator [Bacillota bacterium]
MGRDLGAELDELKAEVKALGQAVAALREGRPDSVSRRGGPAGSDRAGTQCPRAEELRRKYPDVSGFVSYFGFYETPTPRAGYNAYLWDMNRSAESLLGMDDAQVARVLAALANKERLAILKSILKEPASAAELVERLGMGTTGQAYHHLKALQAADLVEQKERGLYCFKGHRVQSLLMLLAGVADALDTTYSSGAWEEQPEG